MYLNTHNAYQLVLNSNNDINIYTSWMTNLSNQTTSLLRPLWLGTDGGLNSDVLLYFTISQNIPQNISNNFK